MSNEYVGSHVNFGVSLLDVSKHPLFEGMDVQELDLLGEDSRVLKRALWDFGLDNTQPIIEEMTTHRTLDNQVVTCPQFRGAERTDNAWINSGNASEVARDKVRKQQKQKRAKLEVDRGRNNK